MASVLLRQFYGMERGPISGVNFAGESPWYSCGWDSAPGTARIFPTSATSPFAISDFGGGNHKVETIRQYQQGSHQCFKTSSSS